MEVCEPPRRLLILTKSPDEPDGVIEATLTADGDQTILVIEDRGLPLEQIVGYAAGYNRIEDLAAISPVEAAATRGRGGKNSTPPTYNWPPISPSMTAVLHLAASPWLLPRASRHRRNLPISSAPVDAIDRAASSLDEAAVERIERFVSGPRVYVRSQTSLRPFRALCH